MSSNSQHKGQYYCNNYEILTTITEHQIRKNVFVKISKIRKKTVHRNYYNYRGLQCPFKVRNNIKVESSQMYEYKKYYCAK